MSIHIRPLVYNYILNILFNFVSLSFSKCFFPDQSTINFLHCDVILQAYQSGYDEVLPNNMSSHNSVNSAANSRTGKSRYILTEALHTCLDQNLFIIC